VSDARLRELERRWRETGRVEHEAAFLIERVRAGELGRETLEVAAYCGHQAARRAVETGLETPHELRDWIRGLLARGPHWLIRASLPLAHRFRLRCEVHPEGFGHVLPLLASSVKATEQWLRCPCRVHSRAAWRASEEAGDAIAPMSRLAWEWCSAAWIVNAPAYLASLDDDEGDDEERIENSSLWRARSLMDAEHIRQEVARFLLGEGR
jgi:hypothetical protein